MRVAGRFGGLGVADDLGQAPQAFVQALRGDVAEVQPQAPEVLLRLGEERFAGHECDIGGQRRLEQGAGIQRLPEGQPEEQPALRDIPFGQLTEVLQQRLLHGVAADPVELAQLGQVLAVGLAAEPLQRLPLPYPVGMQVGRLFQRSRCGNRSGVAIRKPTRRPGSRVFDTVPV